MSIPRITLIALLSLLAACVSPRDRTPRLDDLYRDAAQKRTRNPVIVIHGIMGATLVDPARDETVWGAFTDEGVDPETPEGARAVALPLYDGAVQRHDGVVPSGPLEQLSLDTLFGVVSVDIYADILAILGAGGYRDQVCADPTCLTYAEDHYTCFSFFYDWRRDNIENARALGEFIAAKRKVIADSVAFEVARLRESPAPEDHEAAQELLDWHQGGYRFDIVAHSMGGLIARYYLRYGGEEPPLEASPDIPWKGTEDIDRLIMIGTPNLGAMDAFQSLVEGLSPSFLLPTYHSAVLGTMPSMYQLLPRSRHDLLRKGRDRDVDLLDPEVWIANGWGLASQDDETQRYLGWMLGEDVAPDQRRRLALDHLRRSLRRAARFQAALDVRPLEPSPVEMFLFAADTEATSSYVDLIEGPVGLDPDFMGSGLWSHGDGTVSRYSALGDEREGHPRGAQEWLASPIAWTQVTFLSDDHLGLTMNPHLADNLLFILLEREPPRRSGPRRFGG